jgi:hypothetical protein
MDDRVEDPRGKLQPALELFPRHASPERILAVVSCERLHCLRGQSIPLRGGQGEDIRIRRAGPIFEEGERARGEQVSQGTRGGLGLQARADRYFL